MTIAEKISCLESNCLAIPQLGIQAYNWLFEALHSVTRACNAVVFPLSRGLSATFNENPAAEMDEKDLRDTYLYAFKKLSVSVKNTGEVDEDEVIQVYIKYPHMPRMPLKDIEAYRRVHIPASTSRTLNHEIYID